MKDKGVPDKNDGKLTRGQGIREERKSLSVTEEVKKEVTRAKGKQGFHPQNW